MSNSPKIYLLKNQKGKFYNSKDDVFYSEIINANYDKDKNRVRALLSLPKFANCELHSVTEEEFIWEMSHITTTAVLVGEYFQSILARLNHTLPTVSQVNKLMSNKCKQAIEVLAPFSAYHKEFLKAKEDSTDSMQGEFADFIFELSQVQIYQSGEAAGALKALRLDRASVLGISNKVLKNKK